MHLQIVTFELAGIAPERYRARVEELRPVFETLPGLEAKAWLAAPEVNTYGGVYTWRDRAAMDAYLTGGLFAALRDDPVFAAVRSQDFAILEAGAPAPA